MSRPLRIAVFTGIFPVVSETFILRQITGLLDQGHEVDVYADCKPDAGAPVHPEVAKYRLGERTTYMDMPPETAPYEMPVWPITGRTWPPGSATSTHNLTRLVRAFPRICRCFITAPRLTCQAFSQSEYRYQAASLSAIYRLAKLCSQSKHYDALHAHFGPVGNSFRFAKQLWGAPLLVSFHGYDFSAAPLKEGADMYARLFETADVITINSEFTREQVRKLGCPPAKLHKLPVGLDPDEFPFQERSVKPGEPVRILTIGRLVKKKGHEFSLRAFAEARQKHPHLHYDIVGDGPLRSTLENLVDQLGVREHVSFCGASDGAEVRRRIAASHLFVLASVNVDGDQEGQGLVLQEAQAAGLPVLATLHGAFPEGIVPGQSGFLVPECDVDSLAERLNFLIEHPELWPAMGRQGRSFVEQHFDIRKLNLQLVDLYQQSITAFKGPSK